MPANVTNDKYIHVFFLQTKTSLTNDSLSDMFAVIGRELFSAVDPKRFGSLAKALLTLFQLITLDDWFYMYTDIINVDPGILGYTRKICLELGGGGGYMF